MIERTANIDNFIGVYDGYITQEECNKAINLFEAQDKLNQTLNRQGSERVPLKRKQDQQYFANAGNVKNDWVLSKLTLFS